jgi:hypothetical protein
MTIKGTIPGHTILANIYPAFYTLLLARRSDNCSSGMLLHNRSERFAIWTHCGRFSLKNTFVSVWGFWCSHWIAVRPRRTFAGSCSCRSLKRRAKRRVP